MSQDLPNPQSRFDAILKAMINDEEIELPVPQSRMDKYLLALYDKISQGGGGGGVTIIALNNKTVNGYSVPSLDDDQLLTIYNATVAGKSVTITDATGMMHFSGVTADMVSDEVFVSFLYFNKMILEYGEGDATTFKEIGGGHLYRHMVSLTNPYGGTVDIRMNCFTSDPTPFTYTTLARHVKDSGLVAATGYHKKSDGNTYIVSGIQMARDSSTFMSIKSSSGTYNDFTSPASPAAEYSTATVTDKVTQLI